MKVTVTKAPDGVLYMTKDGHGELFAKNLEPDAKAASFGENTVQLTVEPGRFAGDDPFTVVRFSYVDYLDTANRDTPGKGVRQRFDRPVPGRYDFGPYIVEVAEK